MTRENVCIRCIVSIGIVLCVLFSFEDLSANNIINDLKSKDVETRMQAVETLGKHIDENTLDIFKKYVFVRTEDWKIKIKAIDFLGTVEDREISDFLIKVVGDPALHQGCPAIKRHAIVALGKKFNNDSWTVNILIRELQDNSLLVKEAAIESLGEIGNPEAGPHLIPELGSKSYAIRLTTIRALEKIGDVQAIPYLKKTAEKESDPYLKSMALSLAKKLSSSIIFTSSEDLKH
jgi:HEAT repeat protein